MSEKASLVKEMLQRGVTYNEISRTLLVAKSTIAYHAKNLGIDRSPVKLDWNTIQEYYDRGYCLREVSIHFNIKMRTLRDGRNKVATRVRIELT